MRLFKKIGIDVQQKVSQAGVAIIPHLTNPKTIISIENSSILTV
jgi:hypothetical protein